MSDSKWVNRNLRAGVKPRLGGPGPLPTFRREHGRRKSSRLFQTGGRKAREKRNQVLGTRLFVFAILAVCSVVIVAMLVQIKRRAKVSAASSWLDKLNPYAVDPGPDPIIHNPATIVEQFLTCTTAEQLAAISRQDDNSLEILAQHSQDILTWLEGHREWMPMHEAKANGLIFTVFGVAHIRERPRPLYVVQTTDGPRVDIGAFLGWSSETWDDLAGGRAAAASIVRASVARVAYYNYRFKDDEVFQSYRLDPRGEGQSLYGYVIRGTPSAAALEKLVGRGHSFPVILSLEDGERGSSHRQFRITRVLAAGWAMGPELLEDHLPQLADDPGLVTPVPAVMQRSGSRNN